jgi:ABC-2 type transport system ATP-binding protein
VVTQDNQYAIETLSLTKIFPDWWGRSKVIAVEDLNLNVKHNEVYGLLGPNGSGKTTTLKMLLSLLHPTKGKALILGGSSSDTKISSRVGYLPEDSYLYKYLSARETLDFYGRIFALPSRVRKERIDALLEMVGLTGMANRPVGTFSKGMSRRIGLAQALINDPDVLILDEPTSGMDPIGTRQMKDLFIKLAERGKTILLCSHLLADVEDVCDRIGILYGGRMQVEGSVGSLLENNEEKQIRTGALSLDAMEKIKAIVLAEDSYCDISSPKDRLEEFFIKIVADAQQQKQTTSGAVSTTELTGFLAEEKPEDVLGKLVAADVSDVPVADVDSRVESASSSTTEVASKVEVSHDAGLLNKLSGDASVSERKDVAVTEPVEVSEVGDEQVDRGLLDQLSERDADKGDTDRTVADSEGDGEDV